MGPERKKSPPSRRPVQPANSTALQVAPLLTAMTTHPLKMHREIIPGPVMDFLVLGRAEALRIAPEVPHIFISITTPDAPDARLADSANRMEVLRLQFHDVDRAPEPPVLSMDEVTLFSDEHAREIVHFVQTHREAVRLIVCQCDAGMSRSAGVAAALSRWLQDEDAPFFRYYLPNRLVYDAVLRAAQARS
jgi:predicted protein tyrosine phosphatase